MPCASASALGADHNGVAGPVPLLHPFHLARADILGREAGEAVAQRCEARQRKGVQLHRRGITGHHSGAKAVDKALDEQVAHGDKALL